MWNLLFEIHFSIQNLYFCPVHEEPCVIEWCYLKNNKILQILLPMAMGKTATDSLIPIGVLPKGNSIPFNLLASSSLLFPVVFFWFSRLIL